MIGLKRGTVKLLPYNPKWILIFEKEKRLLLSKLGDLIVDVQHTGSTSIPGVSAKPIIDISVGIKSIKDAEKYISLLKSLGYEWRKEHSNSNHYLFVKGHEKRRTHHMHLMKYSGKIWKNDLSFRDYLRKNSKKAQEYVNLKNLLASQYPNDRVAYTTSKSKFIVSVLKLAKQK